jgi:hypothetical protein
VLSPLFAKLRLRLTFVTPQPVQIYVHPISTQEKKPAWSLSTLDACAAKP